MATKGSDLRIKLRHLTVNPIPRLKDLYQHITPQYAAHWFKIGILLGLPSGELRTIEAGYPTDVKWCCNQMLKRWLEADISASWEKLFTIIESPTVSGSAPDKATLLTSKLDQSTITDKDNTTPSLKDLQQHIITPRYATQRRVLPNPSFFNPTPPLKDLYQRITPQYASDWFEIGILLGLPIGELEDIEAGYPTNVEWCCKQMFKNWLETDITASWEKLLTVIKSTAVSGSAPDKATLLTSKLDQLTITYKDNKTPLLKDLHKQITPLCAVRWREIGALLGLPTATLDDIIECNYRYRVRRCCYAMLKKWLAVDPTASWWKFLAVIESITVSGSAPDKATLMAPELHQLTITDKDSATPSLKDLRQHIIPRYATQWRVIGTLLGLPSAALDSIAHDYEAFRCCFVMLKKWLEVDPTASWSKLLTVIESPAVSGSAPYKGACSREYKVFMQLYRPLSKTLWGYSDELCTVFNKHLVITLFEEKEIMNSPRPYRVDRLLIILASKLRTGSTNLFDRILTGIQLYKRDPDVQRMAAKLQENFDHATEKLQKAKSATEQSTQETQSATAKEKTQQSDLEYELFMKYHSKLNHLQSLVDLTSYFVTAKIINSSEAEAVTNAMITESKNAALRKLLSKISLVFLLGRGDSKLFDKMLKIMQIYGDESTQTLAADLLETIVKQRSVIPGKKVHLISNPVPMLSQTFDHHGGELIIEDHDITITVPQLAVSEGDKAEVQACASLIGPYKLPDGYELVSEFVCIEADYRFSKLVKVTIPHFADIENSDQSFDVVLLTADDNDLVLNEDGDLVLQMHESVYDYQYEVNDDYCDYYTNHFCSKCLARRRSSLFRLFNRLTLSTPREVNYPKTRITVFFCVPDDYASADEMLIELCICYSFKHCLKTVKKSYKNRKMLSSKSSNVPWPIAIDDQKCQNFCLLCNSCPGWKIEPIGSEKIEVGDLDFLTYSSLEDLREQEDCCMYPPRFKISVVRLSRGNILDTEFKVFFENDGNMKEFRRFSLTVAELNNEATSNQQFVTTNVNSPLISNATTTAATTISTAITNSTTSSATDISLASSCHSATASGGLSSATMSPVGSASTPALSTPSATNRALVTTSSELDHAGLAHFPFSTTTAGNTFQYVNMQGSIIYQSKESHYGVKQSEGSFNSLASFAADISESVDVGTILPNLVSHGLLTPDQQESLANLLLTSVKRKQELCGILLRLNERCVKKFLQCLSETSHYDPHKILLNKIQSEIKKATDDAN